MTFAEAVRSCLRQYIGFRGRASRSEYWWFWLAVFLAGLVAAVLDQSIFGTTYTTGLETMPLPHESGEAGSAWLAAEQGPIASLLGLAAFLPTLSVAIRRLHDSERSGWYLLLPFAIAFGGPLILFFLAPALAGILLGLWVLIVLAALLLPLWWLVQPGTPGPNRYGPDPLEGGR